MADDREGRVASKVACRGEDVAGERGEIGVDGRRGGGAVPRQVEGKGREGGVPLGELASERGQVTGGPEKSVKQHDGPGPAAQPDRGQPWACRRAHRAAVAVRPPDAHTTGSG